LKDKHFKFRKFLMTRLVREAGNIISGKDAIYRHPPLISSSLREVSMFNPHSSKASVMLQSQISSDVRLVGKAPSGKDAMPGHFQICNS
jgi:hypothetical protein